MELLGTLNSQAIRFATPQNGGKTFVGDIARSIGERFRFVERPSKVADFNLETGLTFLFGTYDGVVIDRLQLYRTGVLAEGVASTEALDAAISSVETLLLEEFGIVLDVGMPISQVYISRVEVRANPDILKVAAGLGAISQTFNAMLGTYGIDVPPAAVSGITIHADVTKSKTAVKPHRFVFERRAERPYEDGVFFSEAPFSTPDHMKFLAGLELLS